MTKKIYTETYRFAEGYKGGPEKTERYWKTQIVKM